VLLTRANNCPVCGEQQKQPKVEFGVYMLAVMIALTLLFTAAVYARYGYLVIR